MVDKFKVVGLVLAAMLMLGAMMAGTASAAEGILTSEVGDNVTLTGADTGESSASRFTIGEDYIVCPGSTYTGHAVLTPEETEEKQHGFLSNGTNEITVTPHYKQVDGSTANCDASGGLSATVAMNGCDYRLYGFETTGKEFDTYGFATDLVCPEGGALELRLYSGHGHGFLVCTYVLGPQGGQSGGHATNRNGHVDLTGTVTGLTADQSGLCGSAKNVDVYQDIDITFSGHGELGNEVDIAISEKC